MSEGERQKGAGSGRAQRAAGRPPGGGPRSGWRELLLAIAALVRLFALLEAVLALAGIEPLTLREDPFVGFAGRAPLFVPQPGTAGEPELVTSPVRRASSGRVTKTSVRCVPSARWRRSALGGGGDGRRHRPHRGALGRDGAEKRLNRPAH